MNLLRRVLSLWGRPYMQQPMKSVTGMFASGNCSWPSGPFWYRLTFWGWMDFPNHLTLPAIAARSSPMMSWITGSPRDTTCPFLKCQTILRLVSCLVPVFYIAFCDGFGFCVGLTMMIKVAVLAFLRWWLTLLAFRVASSLEFLPGVRCDLNTLIQCVTLQLTSFPVLCRMVLGWWTMPSTSWKGLWMLILFQLTTRSSDSFIGVLATKRFSLAFVLGLLFLSCRCTWRSCILPSRTDNYRLSGLLTMLQSPGVSWALQTKDHTRLELALGSGLTTKPEAANSCLTRFWPFFALLNSLCACLYWLARDWSDCPMGGIRTYTYIIKFVKVRLLWRLYEIISVKCSKNPRVQFLTMTMQASIF